MKQSNFLRTFMGTSLAATVVGCNMTGALVAPPAVPAGNPPRDNFKLGSAIAGVPPTEAEDPTRLGKLVVTRELTGKNGIARSDPFALTAMEKAFDRQQEMERIFGTGGGFGTYITPKPVVEEEIVAPEPQPYRRLSGIVVGDSILAILQEGEQATIITPGMKIPNSEWRVVSIDADKAVLKRSGNVKPTQIIVKLETAPPGTESTPSGDGGSLGGAPGGSGYPGGRPGAGYPGGMGAPPGMGGPEGR